MIQQNRMDIRWIIVGFMSQTWNWQDHWLRQGFKTGNHGLQQNSPTKNFSDVIGSNWKFSKAAPGENSPNRGGSLFLCVKATNVRSEGLVASSSGGGIWYNLAASFSDPFGRASPPIILKQYMICWNTTPRNAAYYRRAVSAARELAQLSGDLDGITPYQTGRHWSGPQCVKFLLTLLRCMEPMLPVRSAAESVYSRDVAAGEAAPA